jgi:trehalose-6-phosphatase
MLAEDERNTVFVISDFSPDRIDISIHNIPNVIIIGNTGLYIKKVGTDEKPIKTHNSAVVWKPAIQSMMEKFV